MGEFSTLPQRFPQVGLDEELNEFKKQVLLLHELIFKIIVRLEIIERRIQK